MKSPLELLKAPLRPFLPALWWVKGRPWVRRRVTQGYASGKIALGEQNQYGFYGDWITVDIANADFNVDFRRREALPFPDGSQRFVYSCHMIEHIDGDTLEFLLKECHRILRPGGAIRLEAPDTEIFVEAYKRNDWGFIGSFARENERILVRRMGYPEIYKENHVALIGAISSYIERGALIPVLAPKELVEEKLARLSPEEFGDWCVSLQTPEQKRTGGHVNPLTFERIRRFLERAGFREVRRRENGVSGVEGFSLKGIERSSRASQSFYVEAVK